jgi:hypothetical protein
MNDSEISKEENFKKYQKLVEEGKGLRYNLFFYDSIQVLTEAIKIYPHDWESYYQRYTFESLKRCK